MDLLVPKQAVDQSRLERESWADQAVKCRRLGSDPLPFVAKHLFWSGGTEFAPTSHWEQKRGRG